MALTWDKLQCTFWWRLWLHPELFISEEKKRQGFIFGTSKANGEAEGLDKRAWLASRIVMLWEKKYLTEKCERIEIFKRKGPVCTYPSDPLLLVLYPTYYQEVDGVQLPTETLFFLKNLYRKINHNENPDRRLIPKINTPRSRDTLLDNNAVKNLYFHNRQDLYDYCDNKKSEGENSHIVDDFRRKYMERHFDRLLKADGERIPKNRDKAF